MNNFSGLQIRGSRAVMVFLHGGAFVTGGGVSYFFGPKLLLEQDIVLVTVQYRLGALGIANNALYVTEY